MASSVPAPSMSVVLSLSITMRLAVPRSLTTAFSSLKPISSEMTLPLVITATSSSIALRRSPKPGAFTAATRMVPRSLFTTSVASASPSTSSAMMSMGLPICATFSRIGSRSFDDRCDRAIDAALERHRVHAAGDVSESFTHDRLSEHGGRRGAVAGDVRRLGRDFLHHLRAHVLERVGQLDLLRDGDAVLGDRRRAELLVDDDVPAFRAEGDLHRVGELVDAALECRAGVTVELEIFRCHWIGSLYGDG